MIRTTSVFTSALLLACLATGGCGRGAVAKVMQGNVTRGDKAVLGGKVSFVPLEGNSAWICAGAIQNGQYRIDARGGVPLGKYRVQVDARAKTGRKVKGFNGIEMAMMDEEVQLSPKNYVDQNSPLTVEVCADSDGRFDIVIPLQ